MAARLINRDPLGRLHARLAKLQRQLLQLDGRVERLSQLLEERTFRLAGRVARLEGSCHAVQCQDGS